MPKLNELEHMADRAFRVRGKTLKELFANAADALFRLQRQRVGTNFELTREVQVEGCDRMFASLTIGDIRRRRCPHLTFSATSCLSSLC
jgi:SHS2 domain-containing protein